MVVSTPTAAGDRLIQVTGERQGLYSNNRIAYCDAAATWSDDHISKDHDDHISKDHGIPGYAFEPDALNHVGKVYYVELKPLLSAFHWRTFALTTLRSFLMYYLPLLEARTKLKEDDYRNNDMLTSFIVK